jgi:hypothetical protein
MMKTNRLFYILSVFLLAGLTVSAQDLAMAEGTNETAGEETLSYEWNSDDEVADLPPNAEAGKCYARCQSPDVYQNVTEKVLIKPATVKYTPVAAVYETVTERVLVKPESKRIEVVPAVYETVTEQMLVKDGYTKKIPVAATYKTVTEEVLDKAASTRLEVVPAVYETVTEKILVSEATTRWEKKKADPNCLSANPEDCYVLCLIEVPAQYKTVTTRVLKSAETTREVTIPAKYKTITKRVIDKPATFQEENVPAQYKTVSKRVLKTPETTREIVIPAEYKTVSRQELKTPATRREVTIPAEYRDVSKRVLVTKGAWGNWEEVICAADLTTQRIAQLQRALIARGYDVGPAGVDNVLGNDTRNALTKFQMDNGLPVGNLNRKTLDELGVK